MVEDFFSKNNMTMMEHPLYSADIASANFCLFPRLKSALKGQCFCYANDIIKNATDEQKRLSQNVFQECFQHRYSHWQKCIVAQGSVA